jgi:hypothetical protein
MADAITNYINTLIFCIVAKVVTLLLLVLLLFDAAWNFSYLILTLEVGLIAIIAYTLYKVYAYQKAIDKAAAEAATAPPLLNSCPDYFLMSVQDETGNRVCSSTYTTGDGKNTYQFTSAGVDVPSQDMSRMTDATKAMSALCSAQQNTISGFAWTDLKSRCGFLDSIY